MGNSYLGRTLLAGLLALGLAGAVAAEPFRLIITDLETPLVPNSVMDLAEKLGYFEAEGVEVELVRVQQTPSALAALQAGEGEMANIGTDALLQLVLGGATDLRAVTSPNKALPFLIAARDGIDTPADLAGASFGVGRVGSLDHSLSMKVLASQGVAVDGLEVVTLGQPSARAQALAAGQIDATTMSIGVWSAMPDKTGLHVLIGQDDYFAAAPVVSKVNIVTQATLDTRGDEVQAVIRALTKLSRTFADTPEVWVDAVAAARPDVERATLETLAVAFRESWSINGGLSADELKYTTDWLYQTEDFAGKPPVALEAWVDFGPVDKVLTDIGTAPGLDAQTR
ncbi:ABC transporter substrate-binding protein [Paracoccaceae bacterium Fryx2]|nr:ABC transporter substrate-binding protein [Paracoccaceae bacterium Fryx2]